jgi:hypothetical protein
MHSMVNNVGRLVEVRITSPVSDSDAQERLTLMKYALLKIHGKGVGVVDMRGSKLLSPAVAETFIAVMRNDNRQLERSAVLLAHDSNSTFELQVERAIREAGSANRKTFRIKEFALEWLMPVLTAEEYTRCIDFLAGYAPPK